MKKILRPVVCTITLMALAACTQATETRTLTGKYFLGAGDDGDKLEAVFTPIDATSWAVAFHFEFQNRPHTYRGTAKGRLGEGTLEGRVQNENGHRTFTFWGSFNEGTFQGEHAEIEGGLAVPQGTLTLKEGREAG